MKYPIADEQTYHAIVERLATLSHAQSAAVRVSIHAAAGGALGQLATKRLPNLVTTESDIAPGQAAGVGGVSSRGYPLLAGSVPAAAASQDASVARNCFYAEGPTFILLRAMVDLLVPGGLLCIAFIRPQARAF